MKSDEFNLTLQISEQSLANCIDLLTVVVMQIRFLIVS